MSHSSSIFSRVPVEMPNRSGFDLSHENLGTMITGQLTPVLVDEVLPNETISIGSSFQVQLVPMVSDFYGRIDFVLESFFVPARLCWGGWQSFMTHPTASPQYPAGTPVEGRSRFLPRARVIAQTSEVTGPTSLTDFLGCKSLTVTDPGTNAYGFSMLPYIAYHRIWDDWYRDSRIQAPLFYRPDFSNGVSFGVKYLPFVSGCQDSPLDFPLGHVVSNPVHMFDDGVSFYEMRQRNWSKDYFTSASTLPQSGNAATVEFDTSNQQGVFSIAALRAANSLQKWMERNNIAGYRYSDQIYAQYGVYPSDAIMDRVIYLGRKTQNVYTRSVFQTGLAPTTAADGQDNPFKSVGTKFGSSQSVGEGSLVDSFRATEHGFIFVLASLVPHAYYSTGIRRYLKRSEVSHFAFPLLSGMGDQAIMKSELCSDVYGTSEDTEFGYTDLYAEYKYHDDEIHGLLRDGQSLEAFALQRSFDEAPELGSEFLQIPQSFLDQVQSVATSQSGYSCWYDIFFPYKKVSPLPEYSLPTLANLKHVHTEYMSRGGKRL